MKRSPGNIIQTFMCRYFDITDHQQIQCSLSAFLNVGVLLSNFTQSRKMANDKSKSSGHGT